MATLSFDDFVNQHSKVTEHTEVDWDDVLENWQRNLLIFQNKVKEFLKPYSDSGKLTTAIKTINLSEEYIGSYAVDTLDINLGGTKIILTPIGTNLIGAKGRVDMEGPRGKVRFVLVPKDSNSPSISVRVRIQGEDPVEEEIKPIANWEWKISTPPPAINYIELTEESFQTALMEVVDG